MTGWYVITYSNPPFYNKIMQRKITLSIIHKIVYFISDLDPSIACSHVRAIYYFTESINSACHFKSYPCKSKADFDAHNCTSCGSGCPSMGYHVDHNASGSYYLKTNWHYPFCSNKN